MTVFAQSGYGLRLDWGTEGLAALSGDCRVLVVVDVLSFSTRVDLLLAEGRRVRPVRWAEPDPPPGDAVPLRSPNGATLSAQASATGAHVLTACLRNAAAVARAVAQLAGEAPIGIVAGGERWGVDLAARPGAEGPLRPCAEDHLGAGAVVAALLDLGAGDASPEASLAALTFRAAGERVGALVAECVSGRELRAHGERHVVKHAGAVGVSAVVPVLGGDGVYRHG